MLKYLVLRWKLFTSFKTIYVLENRFPILITEKIQTDEKIDCLIKRQMIGPRNRDCGHCCLVVVPDLVNTYSQTQTHTRTHTTKQRHIERKIDIAKCLPSSQISSQFFHRKGCV